MTIKDGPTGAEVKVLPKHKKNPEVGEKKTVYSSSILIEQEDALSFEDQEEVRLRLFCVVILMDVFHRSRSWIGVMHSSAQKPEIHLVM